MASIFKAMEAPRSSALLSWPSLVAEVFLVFTATIIWRRYLHPLSDIPGPWLASFSRLWHIRHIWVGDQNTRLIALHEKYGHFVRIAANEVSVSHPEGIKKILSAQLHKGQWYTFLRLPDWRYEQPNSIVDPKRKIQQSKNFSSGYSLTNLLQQEDAVSSTVEGLLGWLDSYAESGEPMDLDRFLTFTTFDILGEALFSKRFGFLEKGTDVDNSIENSLQLNKAAAIMGFFTPWHRILINPLTTELGLLPTGHLFKTAMSALSQREKNPDARNDIVAHWIRTYREHPDRLRLRDMHGQATTSVGAGADTVSAGLQSFVYHTMRHPTVLARIRAEIDSAVAQGQCRDTIVSFADAQKLPYIQACIKEALRIFSPVSMTLPRVVSKGGVAFGSRTFPEGTILSINPWVVHYSKELWGPDAHEFNPSRWLTDQAGDLDKYWITFGAGYNACPGQNLAKMEISKICTTLIRDYNISQVDAKQDWTYHANFTALPHSWPCYIEKRQK